MVSELDLTGVEQWLEKNVSNLNARPIHDEQGLERFQLEFKLAVPYPDSVKAQVPEDAPQLYTRSMTYHVVPMRLTYNVGFDGLPSLSKDGKKMLFARSTTGRANLSTYVMDMTSLNLGPENYKGIPATKAPANPVLVTDFNSGKK